MLFKTTWRKTQHEHLRVALACIDSGSRTDEVYEFCRPWRDVARPVKGQQRLAGIPIRAVRIERDFAGRAYEGAMQLWHVDTTHMKDKLVRLMSAAEPGKSQWHLHREPPQEYVRHLTAEHKVFVCNKRSGHSSEEWVPRPGAGPHDWLDADIYAMAAAEMLAVFGLRPEEQEEPAMGAGRGIREQGWWRQRSWLNGARLGRRPGRSGILGERPFGR